MGLIGSSLDGIPIRRSPWPRDGEVIFFRDPFNGNRPVIYYATHDRIGHFARLPGERWPLYSRYDPGMREMARSRRRAR